MRTLMMVIAGVMLVLVFAVSTTAQNWTSWQTRADAALRSTVTDSVAEHMRRILFSDGKNDKVESIIVEPDGHGLLARVKIKWSGIVLAIDYSAVIRWRFNGEEHLSSDVESAFGLGYVTHNDRVALDDYLRRELYPKVQAAAVK